MRVEGVNVLYVMYVTIVNAITLVIKGYLSVCTSTCTCMYVHKLGQKIQLYCIHFLKILKPHPSSFLSSPPLLLQ